MVDRVDDGRTYLTGKTRHRAGWEPGQVVLVLQVEYAHHASPVTGWRDAQIEDLVGPAAEVRVDQ